VLSAGFEVMASPTAEFKIVSYLAQNPNRTLTLRGQKHIPAAKIKSSKHSVKNSIKQSD